MLTLPDFLSDHTVRGTPLLPGAYFVSMAGRRALSDIHFHGMHLIDTTAPSLELLEVDGIVELKEQESGAVIASARLVADGPRPVPDLARFDAFQEAAVESVAGADLYQVLASRGNDYGERFRAIKSIRHADSLATSELEMHSSIETGASTMTVATDAFTHLIAFVADFPSTYVLDCIGAVTYLDEVVDGISLQLHVHVTAKDKAQCRADGLITDASGRPLVHVAGILIKSLDGRAEAATERFAVAANFTIDPLADVIDLWSQQLERPLQARLADYDQVFQSLLSEEGVFDERAVSHTALIRVADFDRQSRQVFEPATPLPDQLQKFVLPDGREIASLNEYETRYLYQEIFRDLAYRRYDVRILDNDTVFDIGANIGLFSLFAASEANNIRSIAIEPSPVVLPILKANIARYAPLGSVVEGGASDSAGIARFTAYRNSSVFSSFDADEAADEDAIRQVIRNTLDASGESDEELIEQAVDQLLAGRMDAEEYDCRLVSVSDVIREHGVNRIGLLKIDAEKSEDAILAGIDDAHWAIIEQVIIEVHLQGGRSDEAVVSMLEARGFEVTRDEEELLSDSGLITLYAVKPERKKRNALARSDDRLNDGTELLIDAARTHAERSTRPLQVVLCPADIRDPVVAEAVSTAEARIADALVGAPRTTVMPWHEFAQHYPVEQFDDPVGDEVAHIPYTSEWFAATGSALVRRHVTSTSTPAKVIVLDCDNTLWSGVVGEEGAEGVRFERGHLALHKFVKERIDAGMLLCLASKNVEDDVRSVFDSRADLALSWNDVTAHRVNWLPKHENLQSIAAELNLGLNAFVFLDDSPVECGEMRTQRPEVVTLRMPENSDTWADFLAHAWVFDEQSVMTDEDRKRAQRYREERLRDAERNASSSLEDFIAELKLDVLIESGSAQTVDRMSQMTQRTNQFNLSSKRRDTDEMQLALSSADLVEIVTVSDRFGEYGITGLLIANIEDKRLVIDTFLLSCRVLGRGVEHAVLRRLGTIANEHDLAEIVMPYIRSERNEPVARFLAGLGGTRYDLDGGFELRVPAAQALDAVYKPVQESSETRGVDEAGADQSNSALVGSPAASKALAAPSPIIERVASELTSASSIAALVGKHERKPRPNLDTIFRSPEGEAEQSVARIWEEMLGVDGIGAEDSFFEIGGSSLLAVQVIAEIKRRTDSAISVVELFAKPTIAHLAASLGQAAGQDSANEAKRRGAQRRSARPKRRSRG